jgi:hypothetical protein
MDKIPSLGIPMLPQEISKKYKHQSLGMPMLPQEISKKYKCQSLGMPHGTPSSSTKISGHISRHYIFISSYAMCFSWSIFIFAFKTLYFFLEVAIPKQIFALCCKNS